MMRMMQHFDFLIQMRSGLKYTLLFIPFTFPSGSKIDSPPSFLPSFLLSFLPSSLPSSPSSPSSLLLKGVRQRGAGEEGPQGGVRACSDLGVDQRGYVHKDVHKDAYER